MAVKVIGKSEQFLYKIVCINCSSILEYTKSDIESYNTNYDYLGDFDTYNEVKCPNCSKMVKVNR